MLINRLVWELKEVEQANDQLNFNQIELINAKNAYAWEGFLTLSFAPYDQGAFKLRIDFPSKFCLVFETNK